MSIDMLEISGQRFGVDRLQGGNLVIANSISGDELSVDELKAMANGSEELPTVFRPMGSIGFQTKDTLVLGVRPLVRVLTRDLSMFSYGEPVKYLRDGNLFAKFYMSKARRAGKFLFEITCTSAIGLLDGSDHCGDVYEGTAFSAVLAEIIGGAFVYTVDAALKDISVYGWLPFASRRKNLWHLLFAEGVSAKKDAGGDIFFSALTDTNTAALPNGRVFLGGDVRSEAAATAAEVSEHAYIAYEQDKVITLYDGESPAETLTTPKGAAVLGTLVKFGAPAHSLVVENGEILESGVNYAVLGPGSGVKLTGKEYTHTVRVITAVPQTRAAEGADKVARVTEATRTLTYHKEAKTVCMDMIVGSERPGDAVTFLNPYDEADAGFIESMDITMSDVLRASATFISGFLPTPPGNYYTHSDILAGAGDWTVPAGVTKIRVALISGGQGGSSGGQGKEGARGDGSSWGSGGDGGPSGTGGPGGRVYIVTIPVTPGQRITFQSGAGGVGGVCAGVEPVAGTPGTDTVFGTYTTADGRPSDKGFGDLFGGGKYALPGDVGIGGGKGSGGAGDGPSIEFNGVTYVPGQTGRTVNDSEWSAMGAGGKGGGAAAGANGESGQDGRIEDNNGLGFADGGTGGYGGVGADGLTATAYGSGGAGGHGGGGGGAGGPAKHRDSSRCWPGSGGSGGLGGTGGNGASGCAIVYY